MIIHLTIPDNTQCLLKIGQNIDPGTPFYKTKVTGDSVISISQKLHVPPAKIFKFLSKFVGDEVKKGEVLARKKGLFAENKIKVEDDGIIKEINHNDGTLIITIKKNEKIVKTYFSGEVVDIKKNHLNLKVKDGKGYILKSCTADFGGQAVVYKNQENLTSNQLSNNQVLIVESLSPYLRYKAEALGVSGFVYVQTSVKESDLPKAHLNNEDDYHKIIQENNQFCLTNKLENMIYFYS